MNVLQPDLKGKRKKMKYQTVLKAEFRQRDTPLGDFIGLIDISLITEVSTNISPEKASVPLEISLQTNSGAMRVPKARDRGRSGIRFHSGPLPPYPRRT
ncbi:hypothetical protein ACFLQ0_06035 [Nitrospinota bacterium]